MPTNIDDKELARLEALAIESQRRYVPRFVHDACNNVPALVAEVRRLREALNTFIEEDQSRVILLQQQMLDVMREKVEAWEWLFDVEQLYSHENIWRFYQKECAIDELFVTLTAAREAVHADR